MKELERIKKIYKEILDIIKKYEDDIVLNVSELEEKIKLHLFGVKLKEKYGLNVVPQSIRSLNYISFGDYKSIWLASKNQKVKFPVEKEEYFFELDFSTGAFMFSSDGEEYPEEFFNQFWEELKSYKPDYEDSRNHILCWKLENAKDIFNSFDDILKKYYEMNKERIKKNGVERLKKK